MFTSASRGRYVRLVPSVGQSRARLNAPHLLATQRFSSAAASSVFPARYDNTTSLPDGRALAWAEAGASDGHPVFFLHGFPGSRLEARGLEDIGQRHGLRFICPDRPGYGRSTFYPGQRITDWPRDMQSLAQHLKLDRYAVFGGSGGGPYVLACAREIPPSTLSAVGLVCTAAPWEAGTRELQWYRPLVSAAATRTPGLLTKLLDSTIGLLTRYAATDAGKKYLDAIAVRAAKTAGKEEQLRAASAAEDVEARRERLLRIFTEPFAGGAAGFVRDAHLLSHPWGFRLEDVRCHPRIQIWHGVRDVNSPIAMVRYMADRLPHCDLHELEGEDHFTILKHLETMLSELVKPQ